MSRHVVFLFWAPAVLFFVFFSTAAGQCTFPTELQGDWLSGNQQQNNLNITSNSIMQYQVEVINQAIVDDYSCFREYNGKYIVKSTKTLSIGYDVFIYMCFDFTYIADNLYYYNLGSNDAQTGTYKLIAIWSSPTGTDVCQLSTSQYNPNQFVVMVKNGDGAAVKQSCPSELNGYKWDYHIDTTGSGNSCTSPALMDGCTESQLTRNYTTCSTKTFYSDGGVVYCLYSKSFGSVKYLTVFNADTTVDFSTTYRLTCLVYQNVAGTLSLTQYPGQCQSNQTASYVAIPPGAQLTLSGMTPCVIITETPDYTIYIVVGVVGGLIFLFIIGLAIFSFLTWKAKKKPFRGRLEPECPDEKSQKLQPFENGFRRYKHTAMDGMTSREGSPDQEDDTPINVMQLLRKDIITPGGRDSPSSNVLLSVTTPNPYSYHDADSVGGGSLPIAAENPALKKHYHVIGGEPSIGGLEEEDEDFAEEDGGTRQPRPVAAHQDLNQGQLSARTPRTPRTPVMVMPVRPEGSDTPLEGDEDDYNSDDDGLFDADGQSSLVATRQGVGISEPMCPASRLPPIDEGPVSHRSYTGAGNHNHAVNVGARIGNGGPTATFSDQKPTIIEEASPRSETETPRSMDHCEIPSRPSSRAEPNTERRRSSLGLLYKMEGNVMIAVPDIVEQVSVEKSSLVSEQPLPPEVRGRSEEVHQRQQQQQQSSPSLTPPATKTIGNGTVDSNPDGTKKPMDPKGGARLRPMKGSPSGRRGSFSTVKSPLSSADSRKKRTPQPSSKARGLRPRQSDLTFMDDEDMKPKSRVKMTRVDIPELLSPGELARRALSDNELVESPGRSYYNVAYEHEADHDGHGSRDGKLWLESMKPSREVYSKVSHLWRLGQAWPDKPT